MKVNFWKPVKRNRKVNSKSKPIINLFKYPKRSKTELRIIKKNPFGDRDKDKVMNWFDCKPLNKKKQGWAHRGHTFSRERTTHVKMMKPSKFLRTTYRESLNREKIPYEQRASAMEKGMGSQKEFEKKVTAGSNIERLKKVIRSRKGKMEVPFLEYDEQGRPIGHEGRHRAKAAEELGIKKIPVTIARRTLGKEERNWKSQRERAGAKKDWKMELEHEEEAISSKSSDIPIKEQREYGKEKPEVLQDYEPTAEELVEEETAEELVEEED